MSDFLEALARAMIFVLYLLFLPVLLVAATPFVLLWPGRKRPDGGRFPRNLRRRYRKLLEFYKELGLGMG